MAKTTKGPSRRDVMRGTAAGAALGIAGFPFIARAAAPDPVRFSLDFRIYGATAAEFLGVENGIYKDLNLDMTISGSPGSGETVQRVASGTHDFGVADASTLIAFAGANPKDAPKLVMTIYDNFPACILSLKPKSVNSLDDLKHIKLGTGTSDGGSKLLPALLKLNHIDPASLNRVTVDVKLRDTLLLKGEVDAVIGFDYTSIFNLMGNGVKMEDINVLYFTSYGFDFWGNSLIASRAMIEKNPDLVRRVTLATARVWIAGAKDRAGAIAAVLKRDPLLDSNIERQRLDFVYAKHVLTPRVLKGGLGQIDATRMAKGLALLKEGFEMTNPPTMDDVYDGRFLPPSKELMFG
ncbi:MAG: ABC transporter substrate-binding protein [Xanthobacteraceae bacterium]